VQNWRQHILEWKMETILSWVMVQFIEIEWYRVEESCAKLTSGSRMLFKDSIYVSSLKI